MRPPCWYLYRSTCRQRASRVKTSAGELPDHAGACGEAEASRRGTSFCRSPHYPAAGWSEHLVTSLLREAGACTCMQLALQQHHTRTPKQVRVHGLPFTAFSGRRALPYVDLCEWPRIFFLRVLALSSGGATWSQLTLREARANDGESVDRAYPDHNSPGIQGHDRVAR